MSGSAPILLFLSQTFVPDPAAVGQQTADVAIEMARRGQAVRVYAAANGYDDPSLRYPRRENLQGVDVRRLRFASFGKRSIPVRIFGTLTFMSQCLLRALLMRNLAAVFVSTSPPLISAIGVLVARLRGVPVCYWAMDLNPDQLIAMGKIGPTSLSARCLEAINRWVLRRADLVIALDRFMAERLEQRADLGGRLLTTPPWPHDDHLEPIPAGPNPFRDKHGLTDKFVIMYSGNHSPANPLDTLLEAAVAFKDDPTLRFVFVGGGIGKKSVDAFIRDRQITAAMSLPYQPIDELRYSLPAADVHLVSLGQEMAGIVHPCKIYGAMSAGRPVLYLGPRPSHITDLLDRRSFGWSVEHGDVRGAVKVLETIRSTPRQRLEEMGRTGNDLLRESLTQQQLCGRVCDRLEEMIRRGRERKSA